jgi:ABC-type branched-subunit amino acid transport system substrate-binding protein
VYVEDIVKEFPDGAKVAIHHVNSEFGDAYANTLKDLADDNNLDIVTEQTIEAEDANPPSSQVSAIAAEKPDVILAVPLGAQCPTFMSELAKAESANAGWTPRVYITSTCAIPLILQIAGAAANGLYTISSTLDVGDPKNADNPKIKEYRDFAAKQGIKEENLVAAAAGWATGESLVAVLAAAADKGDVTRASIIESARALTFTPSFARPGVTLNTDGETDGFPVESFQVIQWDAEAKVFTDIGDVITKFEGQTEVPA